MMNLPVSYICLRLGAIPETVLIIAIVISQCCLAARLIMLRGMIHLNPLDYIHRVYMNIIIVSLCSSLLPGLLSITLGKDNWISFILNVVVCLACTGLSEYYIGCSKKERAFVADKVQKVVHKIIKK